MQKISQTELKQYFKQIKLLLPIYGKEEKIFLSDLKRAVDTYIEEHADCTYADILERFEELYDAFLQSGSFVPFQKRYREKCVNIGREVRVLGREEFPAVVLDVTPEGELLVRRLDTGREEVVFSGEVSIRKEGTG